MICVGEEDERNKLYCVNTALSTASKTKQIAIFTNSLLTSLISFAIMGIR